MYKMPRGTQIEENDRIKCVQKLQVTWGVRILENRIRENTSYNLFLYSATDSWISSPKGRITSYSREGSLAGQ